MVAIGQSYEEIRKRNIEANRRLLLSLQLSGPGITPLVPKKLQEKPVRSPKPKRPPKQRLIPKSPASDASLGPTDGRRRSGRILHARQLALRAAELSNEDSSQADEDENYSSQSDQDSADDNDNDQSKENRVGCKRKASVWYPPTGPKRPRGAPPPQRKASCLKGARPNPKVFGHQIHTQVGDWWDSRMACSQAGVHAPPVSGIYGNETLGCYSVALSGGYEDDVDLGYAFTYTGSGGRALSGTPDNPKNLRTAPQTSDQEFTAMNAALRTSCNTKHPIRVIRGFKNHSPFAPEEGYRYDGLYKVEKCWREPGQSGFQVCKFAFVRLPNQPKIPVKAGQEAQAKKIYQDLGFKTEQLPPTPEKFPVWSRSLAQRRQKAKQEENDETDESKPQENSGDNKSSPTKPPIEAPATAGSEDHSMSADDKKE
ncbi:hypothetical protein O181_013251 [Austropuccinia psidii MF-1]|uniref:YDG domain-containing protein n=1 Tax=Austropuccinia psidii MF-1 TaxID=1389203 RepID=A0A9Q3BW26_9BASI|nr:hypothetical protein [Austropuccinia psidii MF-1]